VHAYLYTSYHDEMLNVTGLERTKHWK